MTYNFISKGFDFNLEVEITKENFEKMENDLNNLKITEIHNVANLYYEIDNKFKIISFEKVSKDEKQLKILKNDLLNYILIDKLLKGTPYQNFMKQETKTEDL